MSLLMDALKKAEQERKEAAKRIKDSDNGLLQVDRTDDGATSDQGSGWPHDPSADGGTGELPGNSTEELSLAPMEQPADTGPVAAAEPEPEPEPGLQPEPEPDTA